MTTYIKASLCLALVLITVTSCGGVRNSVADQSENAISSTDGYADVQYPITLDVGKNYPKKTIVLQDVAEVTYIPFETSADVLMDNMAKWNYAMSDSLIVTCDNPGNVFFMGRDGRFISKFNRTGRAPNEYSWMVDFAVDFDRDEIYIYAYEPDYKIIVYSLSGKYRRTIEVRRPLWIGGMKNYDSDNLLVYAGPKPSDDNDKGQGNGNNPFPRFYLVSKDSGEFKPLSIEVTEFRNGLMSQVKRIDSHSGYYGQNGYGAYPMTTNGDEFILSDYACDTIYSLRGGELSPFIVPRGTDGRRDVAVTVRTTRYSVLSVGELNEESFDYTQNFLAIDHKTGDVFEPEFVNGDNGEVVSGGKLDSNSKILPAEHAATGYSAFELTDLRDAGKLKGRLAEVATDMKEDDNPVLMLIEFKK